MAQHKLMQLKLEIPVNIFLSNWDEIFKKQLSHNVNILFNREDKKLRNEIRQHAKAIHNVIIQKYYQYRIPTLYDRHGDINGFNLYNSFFGYFNDGRYKYKLKASRLEPYYSFVQPILRGVDGKPLKDKEGNVRRRLEEYDGKIVLARMLSGIIRIPKQAGGDKKFKLKVLYQPIHMPLTTGTPKEIYDKAEDALVNFYNYEIVERVKKGLRSIQRVYR